MKILIVDDKPDNLYMLETLLKASGYDVVTAGDGVEAMEKLKQDSIHMIISDILMPGMDGFQLCRECKTDNSFKKIPFIFYTATYTEKKDEEFALSLGAEKFIVKPIEPDAFLKILKIVILDYRKAALVVSKKPVEETKYLIGYNRRLARKLEKKMHDLSIRNRISQIFLTTPDEDMYEEVLLVILEVMESKYGVFGYIDENKNHVCPSMTKDVWDICQMPEKTITFPHEKWGGIWKRFLTEKKSFCLNKPFTVPEGHIPITRVLDVPIIHKDKTTGNLLVANKETNYDKKDLKLLETIADHIAPVLNARLQRDIQEEERKKIENELKDSLKDLRKTLRGVFQAMALTVETRDPYTAGHQRRVADLSRSIAKEMGLSKNKITGIRIAGALHDIGKIAIPSEILSKPSQLSKTEFELIKNHSQIGYNILKSIKFPWPVSQIVLQHHERMDGSGYPNGLLGKEVLIEGRIVGVADVVEAIASHRPYRPALGIDIALEEISINKNKLYDAEVVNACLKVFKDKNFKFKI